MSSLLTTASPWTNDNVATRKRTPTMKNSLKISEVEPMTVEMSQSINEKRNEKINEMINKMNAMQQNTEQEGMGNFNPPPNPVLNVKMEPSELLPKTNTSTVNDYATSDNLGKIYTNYKNTYESKPYYSKMGIGNTDLMEKINYMIHLLEQQQNEKTDNITEEFILYSFLGIFMIFIVDSFARSGKYVR